MKPSFAELFKEYKKSKFERDVKIAVQWWFGAYNYIDIVSGQDPDNYMSMEFKLMALYPKEFSTWLKLHL